MRVNSEAEMLEFGRNFAKKLTLPTVIELVGDVGAGKTTFTRGLAQGLGVSGEVTSPSFTISKRYSFPLTSNVEAGELIHYDFYRLEDLGIMREDISEVLTIPRSVVIVEWGKGATDLLPPQRHQLKIEILADGGREITIKELHGANLPSDPQPVENLWKTCGKIQENGGKTKQSSGKIDKTSGKAQKQVDLYLDTSTDTCILKINHQEYQHTGKYDLAEKLLTFIHEKLQANQADWDDIAKITFFSGPGSFTGLRIGAAIVNTLADQLGVPLFDHHGQQHQIILPDYGRPANITPPKK